MSEGEVTFIKRRRSQEDEASTNLPNNVQEEESLLLLSSPTRDTSTKKTVTADAANPNRIGTTHRREKEALILQELSSTLHTLQNVSTVLDDIVRLTTPSKDPVDDNHSKKKPKADSAAAMKASTCTNTATTIAEKQQRLMQELRHWTQLVPQKEGNGY